MAKSNTNLVRALVVLNTVWLLIYSCSCSPNFFVVLSTTTANNQSPSNLENLGLTATELATLGGNVALKDLKQQQPPPPTFKEPPKFLKKFPGLPACTPLESADDVDVTLVVQTSRDRLHLMKDICERWSGPISLVVANVWLNQTELLNQLDDLGCPTTAATTDPEEGNNNNNNKNSNNTATTTTRQTMIASVYNTDFPKGRYPVNELRNIALRQARTSHAINLDIDLVPSANLYEDILYHRELLRKDDRNVIVVPAFQLNPTPECEEPQDMVSDDCNEILRGMLPTSKEELVQMYGHPFDEPEPRVNQFTGRDHYYGHSSTGYEAWIKQQPLHSLEPVDCLQSVRYEPYLVVRLCEDLPPYQEQFTGYGKNKVSWMWQVHRTGYKLLRLGSGFTIHYPHPRSTAKKTWKKRKTKLGRENIDVEQYAVAFRAFLEAEVPNQIKTPYCEQYEQAYS